MGNHVNSLAPETLIPRTALFESFRLKHLNLRNRVVMAPMTRSFSPSGVPGPDVAAYYQKRAEGGVALIITEGTWVPHHAASSDPRVPTFYGDAALAGWSEVVKRVHSAGSLIFPQLYHFGLTVKPDVEELWDQKVGDSPVEMGPSGVRVPGTEPSTPMSRRDIDSVIDAFATAAETAQRLGFDGIEIHGAHGYLIDQFFWSVTNHRNDRYGGDVRKRSTFAVELIQECRRRVGTAFPISLRVSQWKTIDFSARIAQSPEELASWLVPLAEAGVDIFHCSTRRYWQPEFPDSPLNLAGWVKKITGKPTITVGSVGLDVELMESMATASLVSSAKIDRLLERLSSGEFDLVAVGRALISDPNWVNKMRDGVDKPAAYSSAMLRELV